ncbi:hypothetical protein Tco_0685352, partial [Tanacetum coccineum]
MGSGSGPARASCAFLGSETGMLTLDVTVDVSTSVSLSVLSESDVDEDLW